MGRWSLLAACAGIAAAIPGSAVAGAHGTAAPCAGHDLTGTFAAVRGSAGAGQISYTVRLRNRSTRACFVSGLPLCGSSIVPGSRSRRTSGRPTRVS